MDKYFALSSKSDIHCDTISVAYSSLTFISEKDYNPNLINNMPTAVIENFDVSNMHLFDSNLKYS